jgi:cytochrome oxidase Cu insertion factor (SCO1/SenC/PrrC family)
MRKRTARMLWLAAGGVVLGLLAIGATSYVMHLDQSAEEVGGVPIGGDFELVDQDGRVVTEEDFAGRLMLVYFGYTFCPDVCPTSLQTMGAALEQLGEDAGDVAFVFVTLDPERDTVAQMKAYVSLFEPEPVGLTGTPEQVAAAAKAWRVYYRLQNEGGDEDYLVDHSSFVYLMDRDGRYVAHFGHAAPPEEMVEKISQTLG